MFPIFPIIPIVPGPSRRPLYVYLCRQFDRFSSRWLCYYTVDFTGNAGCSFVTGPFYSLAAADDFIWRNYGIRRGEFFEC